MLFEVEGVWLAVVHLTWSGRRERDARYPWTQTFACWREFVQAETEHAH